jgi:hypothetical protein
MLSPRNLYQAMAAKRVSTEYETFPRLARWRAGLAFIHINRNDI